MALTTASSTHMLLVTSELFVCFTWIEHACTDTPEEQFDCGFCVKSLFIFQKGKRKKRLTHS